jgi:HPt (histidine-containing phosphotransfer) domain-containing protein
MYNLADPLDASDPDRAVPQREDVTGTTGPVDMSHLKRYTMGDPDLEREVLDLFIAESPRRVAALREAADDREWKMGAWQVAELAQQIERLGFGGEAGIRSVAIERIADGLARVAQFVSGLPEPRVPEAFSRSA